MIAAQLVRILSAAGAPAGTVNYLPSPGGTVGDALVRHPDVELIAFTGSKDVGLHIIEAAAAHPSRGGVKRVIAEMGGKNALIVDADADLDVAVLESVVERLPLPGAEVLGGFAHHRSGIAPTTSSSSASSTRRDPDDRPAGRPGEPHGPRHHGRGEGDHRGLHRAGQARGPAGADHRSRRPAAGPTTASTSGPTSSPTWRPHAVIAQEEIFGPVVAVMKARDMDEALAIANGTQYALTGGLISRSPATIARMRHEFLVGNLYINRGTTGALVERQAFGGFKMSGIGSKAGGPDYLAQFMGCGTGAAGEAAPAAAATRTGRER